MSAGKKFKPEMTISDYLSQEQLEKIFERAFELYEARGRKAGYELEDWRQAEAEYRNCQRCARERHITGQHIALAKNEHNCRRSEVEADSLLPNLVA